MVPALETREQEGERSAPKFHVEEITPLTRHVAATISSVTPAPFRAAFQHSFIMPEDPRTPGPRTPGPKTPGYEPITPGYGTATTPGYGTVQTPGGTRRRRTARPSMVIVRTGSYGFGSFGRMPSDAMRQRVQRTKSHMREQQPLLEPTVDEEDEDVSTPKPPKPSTMDGEQAVAEREAQRDVEVGKTDKDEDDDDDSEETKSTGYLFLLTLGIGG